MRCHPRCLRFGRSQAPDPTLVEHVELPSMGGASGSIHAVQQGLVSSAMRMSGRRISLQTHPLSSPTSSPICVGSSIAVVGHRPSTRLPWTSHSVAVGAHCQEGRLAALRAGPGKKPGARAGEPGPNQVRLAFRWRQVEQDVEVTPRRASPTRPRRVRRIRSVATHTGDEWTEQVALEAPGRPVRCSRWADEAEVTHRQRSARQP